MELLDCAASPSLRVRPDFWCWLWTGGINLNTEKLDRYTTIGNGNKNLIAIGTSCPGSTSPGTGSHRPRSRDNGSARSGDPTRRGISLSLLCKDIVAGRAATINRSDR